MFIPANNVTCKGIVRFVDKNISDEELLNYTKCKNANMRIMEVRRLNRKVNENNSIKYLPTGSVCFTFSGKILPKEVNIYNLGMRVEPYIMPVVMCFNCLRYGHTKNQCRGKTRCMNCSTIHEMPCQNAIKCFHCEGGHISINKNCPEYQRQRRIKEIMSLDNISYYDAQNLVPKSSNVAYNPPLFKSSEFPALSTNDTAVIPVHQRRYNMFSQGQSPKTLSYSTATQKIPPKKRKVSTPQTTYDKEQHEKCLFSPNGRMGIQAIGNPLETPSPQREETETISMDDILQLLGQLTRDNRDLVLAFLTNSNNHYHNVSTPPATHTASNDQ
ncbi:hypothetical protein NQ315_006279 [Exocentrus adspersus]|uniref:CCHC-type domain-containing protein n=1 Tax=Exocentrus adspersus TaxID=1586481 RepID=A0AAV8VZP5_9CUCU|nr:hypothetical protein NQ315_006279 [Exocentrus adspersus]